jgi:hypothetical protein
VFYRPDHKILWTSENNSMEFSCCFTFPETEGSMVTLQEFAMPRIASDQANPTPRLQSHDLIGLILRQREPGKSHVLYNIRTILVLSES